MKLLDRLLRGTPAHRPLVPAISGQCTATTLSGRPCRNPAIKGSDRCVLPAHQKM